MVLEDELPEECGGTTDEVRMRIVRNKMHPSRRQYTDPGASGFKKRLPTGREGHLSVYLTFLACDNDKRGLRWQDIAIHLRHPCAFQSPGTGSEREGGHISFPPSTQAGLPGAYMACRARRWIAEMSLPRPWRFAVPSHPVPMRLMSSGLPCGHFLLPYSAPDSTPASGRSSFPSELYAGLPGGTPFLPTCAACRTPGRTPFLSSFDAGRFPGPSASLRPRGWITEPPPSPPSPDRRRLREGR